LLLGLAAVRDAVRRAEKSVRASDGSAPRLMLAENPDFIAALRAELKQLLNVDDN
jgi:hypothetical protein